MNRVHQFLRYSILISWLSGVTVSIGVAQWASPRVLDEPIFYEQSDYAQSRLVIGLGPERQLAVASLDARLSSHLSTDNGRTFRRTTVDSSRGYGFYWSHPSSVDGIGFDSRSNVYLFWRENHGDEQVSWYTYRVSKSTDGGRTFFIFWTTPTLGGIEFGGLGRGGWCIDRMDRIHCITDENEYDYVYTRLSSTDSSDIHETVLPVPGPNYAASPDIFVNGDSVHIALTTGGYWGPSQLYYVRSTDGGLSFPLVVHVEASNAKHPRFFRNGGQLFLLYAEAHLSQNRIDDDSVVVFRSLADSIFGSPSQLLAVSGYANRVVPVAFHSFSPSVFYAFAEYEQPHTLSFYQIRPDSKSVLDSLRLPGAYSPALTVDSLGCVYYAYGEGDTLFLKTRDLILYVASPQSVPAGFLLEANYPNPFNPTTVISYQLSVVSSVKLVVYDILGREMAVLVNEMKAPGTYQARFDGSRFASGVYFCRLHAVPRDPTCAAFTGVGKLLLVK